jgi:hypothetical protein
MALIQLTAYGVSDVDRIFCNSEFAMPYNTRDSAQHYFLSHDGYPCLSDIYDDTATSHIDISSFFKEYACPLETKRSKVPNYYLFDKYGCPISFAIQHSPEIESFPFIIKKANVHDKSVAEGSLTL